MNHPLGAIHLDYVTYVVVIGPHWRMISQKTVQFRCGKTWVIPLVFLPLGWRQLLQEVLQPLAFHARLLQLARVAVHGSDLLFEALDLLHLVLDKGGTQKKKKIQHRPAN